MKPMFKGIISFFIALTLLCQVTAAMAETNSLTQKVDYYTCSMHPQVRLSDPDAMCPICGMSLEPVMSDAENDSERQLVMSEAALKLADIQTTHVHRRYPEYEVSLFGNIALDDTQIADITAYFPGRIEKLFVNYEGIAVKKGDHLAEIFSPDLITAQQELREALASVRATGKGPSYARRAAQENLEAARDKMRLWGLSQQQIKEIEKTKSPKERLTIYSPQNGIVIKQDVQEGHYLKTGQRIYRVASLDRLWVKLQAYETQLPWLRYGQSVSFTTDAHPGEIYQGKISFISPTVDPIKRTAAIRVNIENSNLHLKPGLFVRATVTANIAGYGQVIDNSLRDKWVCPMHPEVINNEIGTCHICGMDLVPAESMGYFDEVSTTAPLVIPASAPLITGKRAIVFVRVPNTKKPTFESREIQLGPKAGNVYIVKSGLKAHESIVTKGAFKIDSAMQISAKPSMMNPAPVEPPKDEAMTDHSHHH
ncbi:MAG: efflux RND transporter periplasmic adaptor subunit [Pseudomonadales bacterium]|nr:efflux RND transporter periplasmic adaptor subunit [Pseudomonadales bacterium]